MIAYSDLKVEAADLPLTTRDGNVGRIFVTSREGDKTFAVCDSQDDVVPAIDFVMKQAFLT